MKDQVKSFKDLGLNAAYIGDRSVSINSFLTGQVQIILVSPESLIRGMSWHGMLKSDLYQERLVGFIIDEAHLIKNW